VGVVETAQEIVPIALAHRAETESQRCLAPPVVQAMVERRLCRMTLPASLGGLEAPVVDVLHAFEVLAGAEASLPWLAWNSSQVCLFSRFLPDDTKARLFGDATAMFAISAIPNGRAVAVDGGYRVSGRWPLVSGCELADWLLMSCQVDDPDGSGAPATDYVLLARSDVEILDTWHTGGMRGTGSHDVVADDVAVSRASTLLWSDFPRPSGAAIERVPIMASLTAGLAAQMLGVARMALEVVTQRARSGASGGPAPGLADRPRAQEAVARQSAAVGAARYWLHDRVQNLWDHAVAGTAPTSDEIADAHGAALNAMETSTAAVDAMYAVAGTSAIYESSPLERAHRDIHVMARHRLAGPALLEDVGRIRFGRDPVDPLFGL
jgi:indole-3-acetate monooxygenase